SPLELPGFQQAVAGVATGQRPFAEGVAWLAKRGYKTVLHLRDPSVDDASDRRLFEKKGLKYTSLDITPTTLTKEVYEKFAKQVNDVSSHPLFVYDKNGAVAGGLWYLYHRAHLKSSDEKARTEAQRLGLQLDDEGDHATMWLAVQAL